MNRNQRWLGRSKTPKRFDSEINKGVKARNRIKAEDVLHTVSSTSECGEKTKTVVNRSCFFSPDQREFGQRTDEADVELYKNMLVDQYGFNSLVPETISQLQQVRRVLCGRSNKVENSSQYAEPVVGISDSTQWQSVDNTDDIEKFILVHKDEETITPYANLSKNIHISEMPRVKIIAEKFSRYKENNVELRKLDQKVVCIEYDVFDQPNKDTQPIQILRAFFSITPVYNNDDKSNHKSLSELPSTLKNKFNITSEDLQKLSEKEVEMIDGKIADNRPYLDDLRKILRRKVVSKKNKTSLDTQTLYQMATMDNMNFHSDNANLLTTEVLQEVKGFILDKSKSSMHGISRRIVKRGSETDEKREIVISAVSQSIVAELLREERQIYLNKR